MRPIRHVDVWVLLGMLLFALLVQQGRIGASINGVDLTTDPAMYASIAAAYGHPADFARDFVFGAASQFSTHVTPLVQLVHWLSGDDGNYGVAYLTIDELYAGVGTEETAGRIHMEPLALEGWGNDVTYHERLKSSYDMLKAYWNARD